MLDQGVMMDTSLIYFANRVVGDAEAEYATLEKVAQFADANDFSAIWLPERHFHPFGGAYPNPAVMAGVLARCTGRVRLRAGSVVAPLHDPLEIVENWAMVDNLSSGRVDLALASGWVANDFVLAPGRYAERRELTFDAVDVVRGVWAGKEIERVNGEGARTAVRTYPRPVQPELNVWVTAAGHSTTFERAGAAGLNVLSALLFQNVTTLKENIRTYRTAREEAGYDPQGGTVTVMAHTLVGADDQRVREVIREPFEDYLRSSFELWRQQWPETAAADEDAVIAMAFERYFRTASLFGSVDKCTAFARRLADCGVDEIACLVDFGVDSVQLLEGLPHLKKVADAVRDRRNGDLT
ncbi:MupA/Atu3671 family FMN-dependent luciferase-like monooxygenase [Streptomyces sp. NPDC060184]|uniref:MupA/Atu3671 family FMN-dependent luciferase-like monooxygenase n=1 Tax=Streptomyces sp. NPDC060184 TaxID=3347064 RepID=UPI0036670F12